MRKKKREAEITTSLRFPRSLWERVKQIADSRNLSAQQLVQQALTEYCEREKGEK